MLHIIILNKNYFPDKLSSVKPSDKVIILASPDGSIPVSAYKDEALKNMEVKLLPDLKETNTQEGKGALRIAQAMLIGQLTADVKEYQIYTDDGILLKALAPFSGTKKVAAKKTTAGKQTKVKEEPIAESDSEKEEAVIAKTPKKKTRKATEKQSDKNENKAIVEDKKVEAPVQEKKVRKASKAAKDAKAEAKTKPVKLPTQAEVKRVLGAANSGYTKAVMEVIKKSNQITFEMDLRMKLVEAGMDASQCKDLAKTLNDEFGKALPASMK